MPNLPLHRTAQGRLAVLLGLTGTLLGGCIGYDPGGNMAARDIHTYPSTPDWPQNVRLVDHRTGEIVWSTEIPVGQQLVMRFYEEQETGSPDHSAVMRWELMPLGTRFGELDNAMPVPGKLARRVDTSLRREEFVPTQPVTVPGPAAVPTLPPRQPAQPPAQPPAEAPEQGEPAPPIDLPE